MAEPQTQGAAPKVDLTRARALLFDDNQVHLNLLSNVLTSFDLRRQTKVQNFRDAKAAAGGAEFDLILVEARWPRARASTSSAGSAARDRSSTAPPRCWW